MGRRLASRPVRRGGGGGGGGDRPIWKQPYRALPRSFRIRPETPSPSLTSKLLAAELYRLLQVRPIRISPYHLETDGLVERFNQTLKSMLRRL